MTQWFISPARVSVLRQKHPIEECWGHTEAELSKALSGIGQHFPTFSHWFDRGYIPACVSRLVRYRPWAKRTETVMRQTQTERKNEKKTYQKLWQILPDQPVWVFPKKKNIFARLLACFQKPLTFDCATLEWLPILSSWDS